MYRRPEASDRQSVAKPTESVDWKNEGHQLELGEKRKLRILKLVEEDTTPASSEERIPIRPEDTTPICPVCIHGRHWMSFCPYLRRVPDDVTKIGEGYVICCQACGLYDNQCGHNMAYATPIFCFICRSSKHFSRDCPEFFSEMSKVSLDCPEFRR